MYYKTFLFFLVVYSTQSSCRRIHRVNQASDYTYLEGPNAFYKIHATKKAWSAALATCHLENASLFYPKDENEARSVLTFWRESNPSIGYVYVGITDLKTEGSFQTVDGRPITEVYNKWSHGEPNDANGGEDCVVMGQDGTYNDGVCSTKEYFICMKNSELSSSQSGRWIHGGDQPSDYTYIQRSNAFYKIHGTKKPWSAALETCHSENASLFYPKDAIEARSVLTFWRNSNPSIGYVYVGITDLETEGVFKTVEGRPISEVYNIWSHGEPNDANGGEDCVVLGQDGTYNDGVCSTEEYFICKKNSELSSSQSGSHGGDQASDFTYVEGSNAYYKIHTTKKDWSAVLATCHSENASLFYPTDENEFRSVLTFWKDSNPSIGYVYVGITDLATEGVFKTLEGRPISEVYNKWSHGEPNDANGGEDCVVLGQDGTYNDGVCSTKEYFICKKNSELSSSKSGRRIHEGDQGSDYTYLEGPNAFYKIHATKKAWSAVLATCHSEDASLFYPKDENEARSVLTFWKDSNPSIGYVYVGITDLATEGVFQTLEGKPITEVYNKWSHGEPNDANGGEDCVVLGQDGTYNDGVCSTKEYFICKKSGPNLEQFSIRF